MRLPSFIPYEIIKMALESIRANKFRSFLTVLGIVVGVFTAIVIASILTGMRQSIVSIIEDYGTNNIYAFHLTTGFGPDDRSERTRKVLTEDDADAILTQATAVEDIALVAPGIGNFGPSFDDNIVYEGRNYRRAQTDGVSANYDQIVNITIKYGRFITEGDDQQRRQVIVLGVNAADALFPAEEEKAIGKVVRMNGQSWEVIGVLEKRKSGFFGENEEDSKVLLPYRTARKVAPQRSYLLHIIKAKSGRVMEALEESESILRKRRNLAFDKPNDFDIKTADQFIKQFDGITGMVGLIAIAISSLGLLVGGIGVMNIMLVSVTERTKEIGIRKAIGATRKDIVLQFLLEAMTLTFIGGIIGLIAAAGISNLILFLIPSIPAQIPLWAVIAGLGVSILVGLVFGVLPARKASRLDPIECLRYE
ncbi:MAG TPA: ABC transporter permease [Pyrinomonadaceae bacterium]|nr:ABC transporter permease [Pyrinomonadaceae bacterium]